MNNQKCAQSKGASAPALMDEEEDAKNRFAVAILASSRPARRDPEVLLRGQAGSRPEDVTASEPKNVPFRFSLRST